MAELKDLFVIYNPKIPKDEPVVLPVSNKWDDFLRNVNRVEKLKIESKIEEPEIEKTYIWPEYNESIRDWNESIQSNQIGNLDSEEDFVTGQDYLDQLPGFLRIENGDGMQFGINPIMVNNPLNNQNVIEASRNSNYAMFKQQFEAYKNSHKDNGLTQKDWDLLEGIVGLESTYDLNADNKLTGENRALGYFQFLPNTLSDYYSGNFEDLLDNPELQFDIAVKHYKYLKNRLKRSTPYLNSSGLTPFQIMYGMWWRPSSLEEYLRHGTSNFTDGHKNDIISILEKAK